MTWSATVHHGELIEAGHTAIERSLTTGPVRPDRTIWMFWGGPMPEHLVACIGKAEVLRGELDLVVVTPDTARELAPTLPAAWEDLPTWAHKSDVLAPHLLAGSGGLYMDVDTVPVRSIERMVDRLAQGGRDFEVFRNQWDGPSVGVMWSRRGGAVATRYVELLDQRLRSDLDDMRWTELGTPVLRQALADCGRQSNELEPMVGNVALFTFRAWRTFGLPSRDLRGYTDALVPAQARLEMVALFNSKSGDLIAERTEPTIVDDLLDLDLDDSDGPSTDDAAAQRVTFIVKTFNRPRTIEHTVSRLRASFPAEPALVIDDSDDLHLADLAAHRVAHVVIPYDAGLSRGRNLGVQLASTEFVLLHDDDQFPADDLDLAGPLDLLDTHADLDAVGGWEDETPHVRDNLVHRPDGVLDQHRHRSWHSVASDGREVPVFHMVQNQVVWRRRLFDGDDAIRWTDRLKVGEHVDFFFRYRNRLRVAVHEDLHFANVPRALRWIDQTQSDYGAFRGRQSTMWRRFKAEQGVEAINVVDRVMTDFDVRRSPWRAIRRALASLLRRPKSSSWSPSTGRSRR